jgi:ABC-type enterochelin transport system ATPase subunit
LKKMHLWLLILGLILMSLSGYAITMMNMKNHIGFEWFSKYHNAFQREIRNAEHYHLLMTTKSLSPSFEVIVNEASRGEALRILRSMVLPDFDEYVYVYATLGEMNQMDSNIKITQMAQRGTTVEIIAAINVTTENATGGLFFPDDLIRIEKDAFVNKGKLLFVFKNQNREKLFEVPVVVMDSQTKN